MSLQRFTAEDRFLTSLADEWFLRNCEQRKVRLVFGSRSQLRCDSKKQYQLTGIFGTTQFARWKEVSKDRTTYPEN